MIGVKFITKTIKWIVGAFFASTILAVVAYRFIPVYVTPLMVVRLFEQAFSSEYEVKLEHKWVPLKEMSKYMPVAVMSSEDSRFLKHNGFDFDAIQKAVEHNKKSKTKHGASTITQQTAKNVFLWPGRSWMRKGFEMYFTTLIEILWGKERIMEVYLNSIEMGSGIYGVEACAKENFGKTAAELSRADCALIAATLPNPRKFSSKNPSAYTLKRQKRIQHEMKFVDLFPMSEQ
ncbi:MAG: monofunctional biosynthetic peptidoglycan transglycosylase [Prevotellaceae bacterium]|nr:monofunctional biosynthetic peptidoglycan transglycosylase [Prevotellaceae bacterium]